MKFEERLLLKRDAIVFVGIAGNRSFPERCALTSSQVITRAAVFRLVLLFLLLLTCATAMAHKVNMFAYVEDRQIFLEGYFADGKKAMNSIVIVYDEAGKKLWEGRTNQLGEAVIPLPAVKGDLRISLNASMGHKTEYLLSAAEVEGQADANDVVSDVSNASSEGDISGATTGVSEKVMKRMIRREVGEAIKPLVRGLSELKERRGISDIVGGIGIIAGLLGAFFFFQARKLQQQKKA